MTSWDWIDSTIRRVHPVPMQQPKKKRIVIRVRITSPGLIAILLLYNSSIEKRVTDSIMSIVRQLGATWWRSEHAYDMAYFTSPKGEDGRFLRVGWETGGGVWVLSTTKQGADQKGTAIIQNAYTMEERCKAIEKLGGVFYANPVDCPELDLSDV